MVTSFPESLSTQFTAEDIASLAHNEQWNPVKLNTDTLYISPDNPPVENITYTSSTGVVIIIHPTYEYTDNGPVPLVLVIGNNVQIHDYDTYELRVADMQSLPGGALHGTLTERLQKKFNHNPITETLTRKEFTLLYSSLQHIEAYTVTPIVKRHTLDFPLTELRTAVSTIDTIHRNH